MQAQSLVHRVIAVFVALDQNRIDAVYEFFIGLGIRQPVDDHFCDVRRAHIAHSFAYGPDAFKLALSEKQFFSSCT